MGRSRRCPVNYRERGGLTWLAAVLVSMSLHVSHAWHVAVASAYSRISSGPTNGCDGSQLRDGDLTVATLLVPCGARIQVCYRGRCVIVRRADSGPYVKGRSLDLNLGVVRALGFRSAEAWGVRSVRWRRVR